MKKIERGGMVWHAADPGYLDPWADDVPALRASAVKSNGIRFVAPVDTSAGVRIFVKFENKDTFRSRIQNAFRPKAKSEFKSSLLLKRAGIPCAEYVLWGVRGTENIVASKEITGSIPFSEFWFGTAACDNALRRRALTSLCSLMSKFVANNFFHPDFHIGNVMIAPDTLNVTLIDPFGVRVCPNPLNPELFSLLRGLRGEFSIDDLAEIFYSETKICPVRVAVRFLEKAVWQDDSKARADWPRRRKQILSGTSKFAEQISSSTWRRNAAWFKPVTLPPEEKLSAVETFTEDEGIEIWLDSFLRQMLREPLDRVPVEMTHEDDSVKMRFVTDPERKSFYGF